MRELSLFAGAGGGILGTHLLGWRPIGYVEWDGYCQAVLQARVRDGLIPHAPIFGDIRRFVADGYAECYRGVADVVSAGFPCQPFSVAGKQLAADDERNMWPATRDCIRVVRPKHVWLENVPGLIACGYAAVVIGELAAMGYVGRWGVLGAADAIWASGDPAADHERDRLWVAGSLADASSEQRDGSCDHSGSRSSSMGQIPEPRNGRGAPLPDADTPQRTGVRGPVRVSEEHADACGASVWWGADPADVPESGLGRVVDGLAPEVERLRAIGNGQVPAVVATAWEALA